MYLCLPRGFQKSELFTLQFRRRLGCELLEIQLCFCLYHPERLSESDPGQSFCSRKVTKHRSLSSSPINSSDNDSNVKRWEGLAARAGCSHQPCLMPAHPHHQPAQGSPVPSHREDAFHPPLGAPNTFPCWDPSVSTGACQNHGGCKAAG